jgi:hypothetical protein
VEESYDDAGRFESLEESLEVVENLKALKRVSRAYRMVQKLLEDLLIFQKASRNFEILNMFLEILESFEKFLKTLEGFKKFSKTQKSF